jgi:hypothetical protein
MSAEDRSDTVARDAAPASDEEAWTEVLAAWSDGAMHRRYLARFPSLEALAIPGGRYRAVLAERPGDAMAVEMQAEIVKKATALGLAALPRSRPPFRLPFELRPGWTLLAFAVFVIVAGLLMWMRGQP